MPNVNEYWNTEDHASRVYVIYIKEKSHPRWWNEKGMEMLINHPSSELLVGPLEEDMVYEIQMAAMNKEGVGEKSGNFCLRMSEGGSKL